MSPHRVDEVGHLPPNNVHTGLRPTSLTAGGTGNRTAVLCDTKLDVKGSGVEVLLLLAIARIAWTWPRHPTPHGSTDA